MSTFAVTLRYRVLCVTWILCEHWSGRGTGMGVIEKRSMLNVWCAYCDHYPLVCPYMHRSQTFIHHSNSWCTRASDQAPIGLDSVDSSVKTSGSAAFHLFHIVWDGICCTVQCHELCCSLHCSPLIYHSSVLSPQILTMSEKKNTRR
jgi:hypothetical protein